MDALAFTFILLALLFFELLRRKNSEKIIKLRESKIADAIKNYGRAK